MREFADFCRIPEPQIRSFEPSSAFDEHLRRAVHEHISHFAIVHVRLQNAKPEKLGAQRIDLLIRHVTRHRCLDPFTKAETASGIGVQREHRARIETGGYIGSNTRQQSRVDQEILRISASIARSVGRSEERRVGKEWRVRWAPEHEKKKKKRKTDA